MVMNMLTQINTPKYVATADAEDQYLLLKNTNPKLPITAIIAPVVPRYCIAAPTSAGSVPATLHRIRYMAYKADIVRVMARPTGFIWTVVYRFNAVPVTSGLVAKPSLNCYSRHY